MNNPIFNALSGNVPMFGNMQNFINQFNQFKRTFNGDPQQRVQQMLSSGQITQEQLNKAQSLAQQIQGMMR